MLFWEGPGTPGCFVVEPRAIALIKCSAHKKYTATICVSRKQRRCDAQAHGSFGHHIRKYYDPGCGNLHHTFQQHGRRRWPAPRHHNAKDVGDLGGCAAAWTSATTVAVAGRRCDCRYHDRNLTLTPAAATAESLAALGAETRAATDAVSAYAAGRKAMVLTAASAVAIGALTTATSVAAVAISAHTATATTTMHEVTATCGKTCGRRESSAAAQSARKALKICLFLCASGGLNTTNTT